jgi:hypothetical protein
MNERLSWGAILGYGLLLPVAGLIAFDFALGEASRGKGGFEAAWLVILGVFVVPGLLVANCWLFFVRWAGRARVFLAGLALPALIGAAQVVILYGPRDFGRWGNAVLTARPWLLWVFLALFFTPLLALVLRQLVRHPR